MSLFNGKQEGKTDKAGFKLNSRMLLKVKDNKVNVCKYDGDGITYFWGFYIIVETLILCYKLSHYKALSITSAASYNLIYFFIETA